MGRKRQYWPVFLKYFRALCRIYQKYQHKLPSDIPPEIAAAAAAVRAACLALEAYDQAHDGGVM